MPFTAQQQAILDEVSRGNAIARARREQRQQRGFVPMAVVTGNRSRPSSRLTADETSAKFINDLSARAGIEDPESTDQILAALDAKLAAKPAPAGTQTQLEDRAFDTAIEAMFAGQNAPRYAYSAQDDADYRALFGDAA